MTEKKLIVITGPTASGKTTLAIDLALSLHTQIISADSRQCFREMNIGVAKPSPQQLSAVKHYFINSHSVHDNVSAGIFEQYALQALEEIFASSDTAVVVGGTGLYIRALERGLDEIPAIPISLRDQIGEQYRLAGLDWLKQEVAGRDPQYFANGEIDNPRRLQRALEVKLATGRSIREFQRAVPVVRPFSVVKYAIDLPKEQLLANIRSRVHEMMHQGLVEEVRALLPLRNLNALQTVGYLEIFSYLDGNISLDQATEQIITHTAQYAKRQLTWLRKEADVHWIGAASGIRI